MVSHKIITPQLTVSFIKNFNILFGAHFGTIVDNHTINKNEDEPSKIQTFFSNIKGNRSYDYSSCKTQ